MPNRIIREGWLESEPINTLDAAAERFFLRLCLRADDFGRYHANPVLLKSNLFPLREDVRGTDIPRWLAACEKAGLLRCYESDGKRFIEIPKFGQRARAETSKFPQPPTHVRPMTDTCPSNDSQPRTYSETETEAYSETDIDRPPLPELPLSNVGHPTAEQIYAAYPRKVARQDALKAISSAMKKVSAESLLEATNAYAAAVSKWSPEDRNFVPHPATWFNRGSYQDDRETWIRRGPSKGVLEERFEGAF